ncbi:glycoside hydrolase family 9 protein [Paenibacillus methanolicus]|uniref:Endoglucanase n=1 Tax=Paenibacillus methanolicus TaxID=582686 RepID=A0A5S5C496_9BACL|nr:glycoside hydrolase family 9 protein [Paenibacillus methanolicus]TYP73246.1 endoglucanase [Paenibacillus methanolicus]
MTSVPRLGKRTRKLMMIGLGLMVALQALVLAPAPSHAAVNPLPDPNNPAIFDDFDGKGIFKLDWQNWYNQSGGTGAFSKVTVDSLKVGKFAQTPASSASQAKFEPWHTTFDVSGYRYLNFKMKNPGYPNARIRILIHDGYKGHDLTGGFAAVPTTWTDTQIDLDALSPKINKKRIRFEIWLKQTTTGYGEILMDHITGTTDNTGNSPTLSAAPLTSNSGTINNQNTTYTFKATYTDQDNNKPYAMQVVFGDKAYNMREADYTDTNYADGKDYIYLSKLPVGTTSYYFRSADGSSPAASTAPQNSPTVVQSTNIVDVLVSQAGYGANDYKNAIVTSTSFLADTSYQVLNGTTVAKSGQMTYKGSVWGKFLYTIEFPTVTALGDNYTVKTNGVSSFPFPIKANVWDGYKDEMTAFYRIQRASVATSDAYPQGYSTIPPSDKVFHPAGHLDDAKRLDNGQSVDLTGGHYDAGDYGKYGANQWVGAEIVLAYLRNIDSPSVKFDNDNNDIPDLIDEGIFASDYIVKFADQFNGAFYDISHHGAFVHPNKETDGIPSNADDRKLRTDVLSVEGSAKGAATVAATARAIRTAIAEGDVPASLVPDLTATANEYEAAAVTLYDFMVANLTSPQRGDVNKSRIFADVEMYLLTNDVDYKNAATTAANALTFDDLSSTAYWSMRPIALAEFYPVADTTTQAHIQDLLEQQFHYVMTLMDDTPYGVMNQFSNFGVNEPLMSYIGDMMRYYELFGDPDTLRVIQRAMYWVYGQNPWNISWVSGIGSDYVDFIHTRLDEESSSSANQGIVIPGAMVSGANIKDTKDMYSVSPWYEDRYQGADNMNQWRYNEYSVNIQAGMLYTVMGLSTINNAVTSPSNLPELQVSSPILGDYVRGDVTVFASTNAGTPAVRTGGTYVPMTLTGAAYEYTFNTSTVTPLSNLVMRVRGNDTSGNHTFSNMHYTVAQPLPDPSHPLLFDDFDRHGLWGLTNGQWVNWWNQNGGNNEGTFSRVEDTPGNFVGKFTQNPSHVTAQAKFQHWNESFNVDGYRYVNMKVKNPSHPNLRMMVTLSSSTGGVNLTNGWISIPTTWTDLQFDTSTAPAAMNRKNAVMTIWLNQTVKGYGEMFMDDLRFTNTASGTAPTLTAGSVNAATGNTQSNFAFTVTYTDADNQAPYAVELVTDGVVRKMVELNPSDTNYADGKQYRVVTRLSKGNHKYYFTTTDMTSDAVSTTVATGPSVN